MLSVRADAALAFVFSTADSRTDVSYWKHTVLGGVGFVAEVASAAVTGKVAQTGVLRQLKDNEIQQLRAKESSMSA